MRAGEDSRARAQRIGALLEAGSVGLPTRPATDRSEPGRFGARGQGDPPGELSDEFATTRGSTSEDGSDLRPQSERTAVSASLLADSATG